MQQTDWYAAPSPKFAKIENRHSSLARVVIDPLVEIIYKEAKRVWVSV